MATTNVEDDNNNENDDDDDDENKSLFLIIRFCVYVCVCVDSIWCIAIRQV